MKLNSISYLMALALTSAAALQAKDNAAEPSVDGAVYTIDNAASGNHVLIFPRRADGSLLGPKSQPTGGLGTGGGLGSQGAVLLTRNGQWLLVCNAGSDEISVFAVDRNGLQLTDKVNSGGRNPTSLTLNDDLLYVLNAGGGVGAQDNISGFHFAHGHLSTLPGATRTLSADNTGPAQVAFASDGDLLVVTEKATSLIDTFTLGHDGLPNDHKIFVSPASTPFGFAAGRQNRIFVSNAAGSSLSSYEIDDNGSVEVISNAVPTEQNAACWVVINENNRFAYTANAASGSISGFRVDHDGNLQQIDADGRTGVTGDGSHPADMALSDNSRFLYTLNTGNGTVTSFRLEPDGSLQNLGSVSGIPASAAGLAAQ